MAKRLKTPQCPQCGSAELRRIQYGLPPPEVMENMVEESRRRGVVFGGCVVRQDAPTKAVMVRARAERQRQLSKKRRPRDCAGFVDGPICLDQPPYRINQNVVPQMAMQSLPADQYRSGRAIGRAMNHPDWAMSDHNNSCRSRSLTADLRHIVSSGDWLESQRSSHDDEA